MVGLIFLFAVSNGANILGVFPIPFFSHHAFNQRIVDIVLERGDHVTVLTEISFKPHENLTEIRINESTDGKFSFNILATKSNKFRFFHDIKLVVGLVELFWRQLSSENVQRFISQENRSRFDLVLLEHFYAHPFMAFAEIYDCPIVMTSSLEPTALINSLLGNDVNPVTNNDSWMFAVIGGEMNIVSRLQSLLVSILALGISDPILRYISQYQIHRNFPGIEASLEEIEDRVVLMLANTNQAMGFIRPSVNTIQVGFLTIEPPKPLPESELKTFVDDSENGVIFVSFGTIADGKYLKAEFIQLFLNVFEKLDFDVVWKTELDNVKHMHKAKNIFITSWVPQADLLAHPKLKIFFTHAGMLSLQEAIDRTVPMILFPICGDQHHNSALMERKGVGLSMDLSVTSEDQLLEAITEVLKPKFKENIARLRELVYDQPMTSLETASWWIEHILRRKGGKHLQYAGRKILFYQKYCIDVVLILASIFYVMIKIVKVVKRKINWLKERNQIKKNN